MGYLKSVRFLKMLFFIVTLVLGCLAMISVSQIEQEISREVSLQAASSDDVSASTATHQGAVSDTEAWIVKAYEERIGVFRLDGQLECVLDVYLITLPQADQKLLRAGIYISGKDRLTALMEDYTG